MTSMNTTSGFVRALRRKSSDGAKDELASGLAVKGAPPTWPSPIEPTMRLEAGSELNEVTRYIYEHWHGGLERTGPTPRLSVRVILR